MRIIVKFAKFMNAVKETERETKTAAYRVHRERQRRQRRQREKQTESSLSLLPVAHVVVYANAASGQDFECALRLNPHEFMRHVEMHLTLIVARRGGSSSSFSLPPSLLGAAHDDVRLSSLKINGNAFNLFLGVLSCDIARGLPRGDRDTD